MTSLSLKLLILAIYSLSFSFLDLQKVAQAIQEFQSRILHDVDAAKLRDSLNLALLQMQTYWKVCILSFRDCCKLLYLSIPPTLALEDEGLNIKRSSSCDTYILNDSSQGDIS